ncbi:phospholipase A [Catalinimonas niigatensis]|uniref:phospholipase A n=1 Tax=Catalinimonas niigatensis TaxID=1397264 RepID=UPI002666FECF|nr:phospholipase A [Catalinimonas niigatensis]WPP49854.1 phospholipase A [Catalinimonas niigatensis]
MRTYRSGVLLLLFLVGWILSAPAQSIIEESKAVYIKSISERWELDSATRQGVFRLTYYKPFYVTAGRWSSNPNEQPRSENPNYSVSDPIAYNNYEAKFQLSFKTKLLQTIFWGYGDLWMAYTQKAHWQIYNTNISRAFRELNYEPELILNFPINIEILGFRARTLGVAFNHQSNGREVPLSRSWNRIIFHMGLEREHWMLVVRPWIRLPDEDDENPLITDYIGRGELTLAYSTGKHQLYLLATSPLRWETLDRGSTQLNWVFHIEGNIKGQLQLSTGYGETMIDYNHRQTTIGLGVSFVDW